MTEFSEGLNVQQLNPPQIVSFLQGLARRLHERLTVLDNSDEGRPDTTQTTIEAITDHLSEAIQHVQANGYSLNSDLPDYTPADIQSETAEARAAASALELAQRVSGVPTPGWTDDPELIDELRNSCAMVAELLRTVGDEPDPNQGEPT